jgi:hypothetical protein
MKLGRVSFNAGDFTTARTALIEAHDGWSRLGKTERAGGALAVLGRVHWAAGDSQRGFESLARAISILEELSIKRSLPRRQPACLRAGKRRSRARVVRAKAMEGVESLEAQPRGTSRRMGRGTLRRWRRELGRPYPARRPGCRWSVAPYNR